MEGEENVVTPGTGEPGEGQGATEDPGGDGAVGTSGVENGVGVENGDEDPGVGHQTTHVEPEETETREIRIFLCTTSSGKLLS